MYRQANRAVGIGLGFALLAGAWLPGAAGAGSSAPRNVLLTKTKSHRGFQQPVVAADPHRKDALAVAYHDAQQFQTCYLSLSSDGGRTWKKTALAGDGAQFELSEDAYCWNPWVTFGPDSHIYYVFQTGVFFGRGDHHVYITISRDGGKTFEEPKQLTPQDPAADQFWPSVAVHQKSGRVYVVWDRLDTDALFLADGVVEVAASDDEGRTFSIPVPIFPGLENNARAPVAAVGSGGKLYVGWLDVTEWNAQVGSVPAPLEVTMSEDGQTFTMPVTVANPFVGIRRMHVLSASPSGDGVVATWWDARDAPREGEKDLPGRVFVSLSEDAGATWSEPRRAPIPRGRTKHQQRRPSVSLTGNGRVHLAYYDQSPKDVLNVYWTSTSDQGKTFSPPRRLNSVPFSNDVGPTDHVPGEPAWGDFLGIASSARRVFVAWTDSRRGEKVNGKQDIFFAGFRP